MEINRKQLEQALNVPDERFEKMVGAVVQAAGGNRLRCMAAMANAGKIKKKLLEADDGELERLAQSLDPRLLQSILDALKGNGK